MSGTPWGDADSLRTRRLRPGRGSSREATEASQRERLFIALVALSAERGYRSLRVEDLTNLAGISRGAFYAQFGGKDECLTATVDALVEMAARAVATVADGEQSPDRRLGSGLHAVAEAVASQPAAARLVLVDAYGADDDTLARAEQGLDGLQELTESTGLPPEIARGLAGGVRWVAVSRLRERREEELPGLTAELTRWILGYAEPTPTLEPAKPRAQRGASGQLAARDQAERIMIATLAAVAEKGYAAATIGEVATRASTSTRTFYEEFDDKQDAYLAALDFARVHAYAAALAASRRAPDWPSSIRAGIQGLCAFLAAEPEMARASVLAPYGAGEPALERHDRAVRSFTRALSSAPETTAHVSPVAIEAIGGAIESLLFDAIRHGGDTRVRAVAPTATFVALAPFIGADAAAELASDAGPRRTRS
jgi:AcrR family transcriptional regulator